MVKSNNSNFSEAQFFQNEDMILSERLAFTGRIAASIAHEIRNPLTNVSMSVQQLKDGFSKKSPWARHVEIIIKNTERIDFLITELLNCARPPKLNMQPYDIHKILENVIDSISTKLISQHIEIEKNYFKEARKINIDKEQINRVFLNVILNALEAMSSRGRIHIATKIDGKFFIVRVKDTGEGIPEEDVIRIFDPFFSTKPSGIGLGLFMTYGIVVSHGGAIGVESVRNKGSIFTISLPYR